MEFDDFTCSMASAICTGLEFITIDAGIRRLEEYEVNSVNIKNAIKGLPRRFDKWQQGTAPACDGAGYFYTVGSTGVTWCMTEEKYAFLGTKTIMISFSKDQKIFHNKIHVTHSLPILKFLSLGPDIVKHVLNDEHCTLRSKEDFIAYFANKNKGEVHTTQRTGNSPNIKTPIDVVATLLRVDLDTSRFESYIASKKESVRDDILVTDFRRHCEKLYKEWVIPAENPEEINGCNFYHFSVEKI